MISSLISASPIGMYLKIGAVAVIAGAIFSAYIYVTNLQSTVETLTLNLVVSEQNLETAQKNAKLARNELSQTLSDLKVAQENTVLLGEILQKAEENYAKNVEALKSRSSAELERIVKTKPNLFTTRARAATQRMWKEFENSSTTTSDPEANSL